MKYRNKKTGKTIEAYKIVSITFEEKSVEAELEDNTVYVYPIEMPERLISIAVPGNYCFELIEDGLIKRGFLTADQIKTDYEPVEEGPEIKTCIGLYGFLDQQKIKSLEVENKALKAEIYDLKETIKSLKGAKALTLKGWYPIKLCNELTESLKKNK